MYSLAMKLQVIFFSILFVALFAFVDVSIRLEVKPHMLLQISILSEGSVAVMTHKRFFSSMDSHVIKEIPCFGEDLATVVVSALKDPPNPPRIRVLLDKNLEIVR